MIIKKMEKMTRVIIQRIEIMMIAVIIPRMVLSAIIKNKTKIRKKTLKSKKQKTKIRLKSGKII